MIPDAKIKEIRERADIVDVIGDYVTLRRAGSNFKGVCPFHADSDPSFNVNPARQFYHCFGCSASGDVFKFLQNIEGVEFLEAARRLAGRYGVELPERDMSPAARTKQQRAREESQRRRLVLEEAASFFEEQLRAPSGAPGREALAEREVDMETATRFRLGYAPDGWSGLIDAMVRKRITPRELESVGLVLPRKSGQGFYDRFRHRLMFTITDGSGHAIAFSGRALATEGQEEPGAKYINSPETREYTKGKVLYGLHQARVPMSKTHEVVLVEGNFDVVSLSRVGIENVVAPLGTALTTEQTAILSNRIERVVVLFDGDAAGRKAAARAFPLIAGAGLAAYTVPLPPGEDPDTLVRREGVEQIRELFSRRIGLLDQIIEDSAAASDGSLQDVARRIEKLRPFIGALGSSVERDLYRERIASVFKVDHQVVFRALRGGHAAVERAWPTQREERPLPGSVAERELIGLLLDLPELWSEVDEVGLRDLLTTPELRDLVGELGFREQRKERSVADIVANSSKMSYGTWLAERAMERLYTDIEKARRAIGEIRKKLADGSLRDKIKELDDQIHMANSAGDEMRVLELSRKKASLQSAGKEVV